MRLMSPRVSDMPRLFGRLLCCGFLQAAFRASRMTPAPWLCRSCFSRVAKPLFTRQLRLYSTGMVVLDLVVFVRKCSLFAAAPSETIPQGLLTRARNIAIEHKQLTEKLADGFDSKAAKKVGEYSRIVEALRKWDKANEVSFVQRVFVPSICEVGESS